MRRFLPSLAVFALALIAVPALPAQAASSRSHSFTDKGLGAEALWSTFPARGGPTPGVIYTDTYINATQEAVAADGTTYADNFVYLDEFRYEFNSKGRFIFVSDTFGSASGSNVTLSVSRKLDTATAGAKVRLRTCDQTGCSRAGTTTLSASWTGVGAKALENGTFIFHTKGFTEVSHQHGFFRDATATATVANLEHLGRFAFGDIFNVQFKDVCIGSC